MSSTPSADAAVFTIRELCDAFDVTPRTLRFYETQGLLSPLRDGQRRLYNTRDRARLALIVRGKRFGFSLSEIGELLDLYDLGDGQRTQLERTLETAREKRAALYSKRDDLDAAIADLETQLALVETMIEDRAPSARNAVG